MKYTLSFLSALLMSLSVYATESRAVTKGFHDCSHAVYGQAEMFVSSEQEVDNNNSFTLLPDNSVVDDRYVPFQVAGITQRIGFIADKHVFEIKHTGYYKIGYWFKCYGAAEEVVPGTLDIGVRITDKNGVQKQVYAFHKLGYVTSLSLLRNTYSVSDQCVAKLRKGDTVGLYIFGLPPSTDPLVYANIGSQPFIPDTAASLSVIKAQVD